MLNRLQSREETFFKEGGVDVPENEEREQLLEVWHFQFCSCSCFEYFEFGPQIFFQVLGYYWHLQHHLGKALREGLDKVRVFLFLLDKEADRRSFCFCWMHVSTFPDYNCCRWWTKRRSRRLYS